MKTLMQYISETRVCESKETFKTVWEKMLREKQPILQFPNGGYMYVNYNEEEDKLEAGSATNSGFTPEYSVDCDYDHDVDWHLQGLYDVVVEEHPEYNE